MLNSFKATIRKLASLPIEDLRKLLAWSDGKDVGFSNRNLLVASAAKHGEVAGYLVAEPTLMVTHYVVSPQTTLAEAGLIGDVVDASFEVEARKIGADRFMMVLPAEAPTQPDEHVLRVVYRNIPQKATTIGSPIEKFFSNEAITPKVIN